jgi:hypothetical protein
MPMAINDKSLIPLERVKHHILVIRGQKVILDSHLATLYGVTTSRLNEQVKRNIKRFPSDFMFQLSKDEFDNLKSHFATSSLNWGGRRKLPYAFTEHGALMAATVLKTDKAVQVSVYVVRAFVQLRRLLESNKELARRLEHIESHLQQHDDAIISLAETLNQLMAPPEDKPKTQIGFLSEAKRKNVKKNRIKNTGFE